MSQIDGKMIRAFREANGISQTDFGKMMGVALRTVQNWESGNKIPPNKQQKMREVIERHEKKAFSVDFLSADGQKADEKAIILDALENKRLLSRDEAHRVIARITELEEIEKRWTNIVKTLKQTLRNDLM
ncbi:MAG: helix-turn-helix domain-containing protein [Bacteroidota bacterium]